MESATTDKETLLAIFRQVFWPSLVGIVGILLFFTLYKWKTARDKWELDKLHPGHMRTKMEALAAAKLAERKQKDAIEAARSKSSPPDEKEDIDSILIDL
ncbi:MAG: hypothetical protein ABIC40_08100 [bacterium]